MRKGCVRRYEIEVPEDEAEAAGTLDKRWRALFCDSKTKDLRLSKVKDEFRTVTSSQAVEFETEIRDLNKLFYDEGPGSAGLGLDDGVDVVKAYKKMVAKAHKRKLELVNAQNLFGLPITTYPVLAEMTAELDRLFAIYTFYSDFKDFQQGMSNMLWAELDIPALGKGTDDAERKARKFPKELKEKSTFKAVEQVIVNFKESLPLIVNLKNDSMKERHWLKLMEVTGVKFDMNPKTTTLENIFAMELHNFGDTINEIVVEAQNELKIETEIRAIETAWASTVLETRMYAKDGVARGYVLAAADDVRLALEDNMLNLQTMAGSRFVGQFAERVRAWEKCLNLVAECLEVWFTVQRQWMYLESIFVGAEDIRMQLPEEAKKFDAINKAFKGIMTATNAVPNVVKACTTEARLETLVSLGERLVACQKSLTDYLDTKRNAFPRFFFISDDELLSVLGSSDPTSIQVHMLKLFDNVKSLDFSRNKKLIVGMNSSEGEGFALDDGGAPIEGPVEVWMTTCEAAMVASLRSITKEGVYSYAHEDRLDWLKRVLGMVGLVGLQVWWTWETEDVFRQVRAPPTRACRGAPDTSRFSGLPSGARRR